MNRRKIWLLSACLVTALPLISTAQQFKWAQNNGAGALLSSNFYLSPTLNSATSNGVALNETWVAFSGNPNHLMGAGGGTSPDIGLLESNNSKLARYDASMNLVWIGYASGIIAADPHANDQFYLAFTSTAAASTYGGFSITGQAAASAGYLAKCRATGALGFTVLSLVKIDGASDESFSQLRVKDLGNGNTRIALTGVTRSPTVSNYTNGTTGVAQTTPVNGGGGTLYDYFISEYNDDGSTLAPLWISTFGNSAFSESGSVPMDITDDGDILFAPVYTSNTLGASNYTLNNSSGSTSPGTVTSTSYNANITNSRYLLFRFDKNTGAPTVLKNDFSSLANFTPLGIATDAARNIFLYGQLTGTYTLPGGITIVSAGSFDAAVVVLDNAGTALRAQRYGGLNDDRSGGFWPYSFALDRANGRMFMAGRSMSTAGFTAGAATVQYASGYSGFILAAGSTGTMSGLSAVSLLGSVSGSVQDIRSVVVRPDGTPIGAQQFSVSGYNRLNGSTTNLLPKTSFGYTDFTVTRFNGSAATLLTPELESLGGSSTSNTINGSAIKSGRLLLGGVYNGAMTVGTTTITGAGMLLVESDTATGIISLVKAITGTTISTADIRVNPADGSVIICGGTYSDMNPGTALGKSVAGNRDAFIMKLDASYNHLWTAYLGGVEADYASGFTLDPATGDIYVTGLFNSASLYLNPAGATTYGSTVVATNSNPGLPITSDIFVAKFNISGVMQWVASGGSASTVTNDLMYKGIAYQAGGLYVGSVTPTNSQFNWGASSIATASTGSAATTDLVMMRLDPANGTPVWMKTWGGNTSDFIQTLATGNGKIYVGGYSGSGSGLSFGGIPFVTSAGNDAFIFAVDPSGAEQSGFTQLKGTSNDVINELKVDAVGNIFFAGQTNSQTLPIAGSVLSTAGNNDILLGSVDPESMAPKFGFLSGSIQAEGANTITPGSVGMAFVGGNLLGTATFGTQVLNGRLGGDFVYARVDYPFRAPGAQLSNLNAWFKSNALLTGSPVNAWQNSSANSSLTTLNSTGTVPVSAAGANFNPSLNITGGSGYVSQPGIFASNFLDASGSKYSIYTIYKPSSSTDRLSLWNETTTGTGLSLDVTASSVTGTAGLRSIAKTTAVPMNQFSLDALVVNGGAMSSFLNGRTNGTQTGASAVNLTNAGAFQVNGTGNMEVAEVVVYGGAHTGGQPTMNQIDTYFGVKYGITLSHHYYSTVGDTLFKVDGAGTVYLYDNNIAGLAVDSNEMLIQKQGRSQNAASKGNMLTMGLDSIAASNAGHGTQPGSGVSYLVWGDDAAGVTATQTADMPGTVSSCAYRFPREWKINRTGTGIGATQVQLDLAGTIPLGSYTAGDFQLMIDRDGDGNFLTGATTLVNAAVFAGSTVTFNNVVWDADGNSTDVFTLLINNNIPNVALATSSSAIPAIRLACPDVSGTLIFADNDTRPTEKYLAVYPNGNTGYNFSATAINNNPAINNQRKTNGSNATSALSNRMYVISDAGVNNYPSGMKVRVYYTVADSLAAVAALDPAVAGTATYRWFRYPGTAAASVLADQTVNAVTGATWLTPAAYGVENGISYVEFSGITSFGTFGALATRASNTLPLKLLAFRGVISNCSAAFTWETAQEEDVHYFELQWSPDGLHYTACGRVGALNGTGGHSYSQNWPQAATSLYYRLRMVDRDSASTYSQVVSLNSPACAVAAWTVMPNPVSQGGQLSVTMRAAAGSQHLHLVMSTLHGQKLLDRALPLSSAGAMTVSVPTEGLAKGVYVISLQDAGGRQWGDPQKVVVR